jgi:hypothetical protein
MFRSGKMLSTCKFAYEVDTAEAGKLDHQFPRPVGTQRRHLTPSSAGRCVIKPLFRYPGRILPKAV